MLGCTLESEWNFVATGELIFTVIFALNPFTLAIRYRRYVANIRPEERHRQSSRIPYHYPPVDFGTSFAESIE